MRNDKDWMMLESVLLILGGVGLLAVLAITILVLSNDVNDTDVVDIKGE